MKRAFVKSSDPLFDEQASDLDWFLPMVIVVALQLLLWLALAHEDMASRPLFGVSGLLAYTFMALVVVARYLWFIFRLGRNGEPHPVGRSVALLRDHWSSIVLGILAVQLISLQSASFQVLKAAIPSVNPFWLDPYLARVDVLIFGEQPWRIAHSIFGGATRAFDAAYFAWVPIQIIAFFSLLLMRPSQHKTRAIVSLLLIWLLLGLFAACVLSSAGPIYYDRLFGGHLFGDLSLAGAPNAARDSADLWTAYESGRMHIGSGISAMPSMHVALALWLALVLRRTILAPLAWSYVPVIWLASVLLGWHYSTDGLLGLLGAAAVWKMTPSFVERFAGLLSGLKEKCQRVSMSTSVNGASQTTRL